MSDIPVFFLHGLAYAGLLFLVSAGLTLVFGLMNVLNFAHAAMYMLGAYFSYTLLRATGQFWLCLVLCPVLLFVIGALVERFLLRRVHVHGHLHELLLTFGLAYIITELVKWVWGNFPLAVNIGGFLGSTVRIFDMIYPVYRIFIFACAVAVGVTMAVILYKTRLGIILRAAVNDSEMVNALGFNVPLHLHGRLRLRRGPLGVCGRHRRAAACPPTRAWRTRSWSTPSWSSWSAASAAWAGPWWPPCSSASCSPSACCSSPSCRWPSCTC